MKKIISTLSVFVLLALSTVVFAQSTNWADYGLDEEAVKYLSEEEKQNILNSKTPEQTQKYFQKGIQDGSVGPEEVPLQFSYLLDQKSQVTNTAENIDSGAQSQPISNIESNPSIVSCFDYYAFNSVETNIQSRSTNAVSGMTMDFFGDIKNNNPYPVVQGTLYVKIMKNIGDEKNPNGPDVVDQFIAMDNVTLPAKGSVPLEFKWNIPAYAVSGDYRVVTYFTSNKKFNLQGLSFTDDIVGNSFDFKVSGGETGIQFDKSSVLINNNPYYFAAYPPRMLKAQSADIKLSVINDTDSTESAKITWNLYKWDAMSPNNLVRTFITNTEIKANSTSEVVFSIPEESEPVYLLVGELTYKDTKSIVNIRYVRDGVDKVRLNYPAVMAYPLVEGQQTTLFTCLHNSGQSAQVSNNKVILEVKDGKGKVIESYTYEGVVTGDMMAVKKDFIPKTNLDKFSVHASVYTNGKLMDESVMEYDCALIDPTSCTEKKSTSIMQIVVGLLALVLLIIILVLIKKKTKGIELLLVLFVVLFASLFLDVSPSNTGAQSGMPAVNPSPGVDWVSGLPTNLVNPDVTSRSSQVVWNTTIAGGFAYFWNRDYFGFGSNGSGWEPALTAPNITVKYNAKISDSNNQYIRYENGATVSPGTKLRLQFIPHHPYDIYWFGTGYSSDSPYGEWEADAAAPPLVGNKVTCERKDFVKRIIRNESIYPADWHTLTVYIPLVIAPPSKTLTNLNGLTCEAVVGNESQGYYRDCVVNPLPQGVTNSTINPQFSFAGTTGKMYYRYYDSRDLIGNFYVGHGCQGNNTPLRKGTSTFQLQVPVQKISYTLNVVAPQTQNKIPTIAISGPIEGTVGETYNFSFLANDPDNNKVKVEIDWDNDENADAYLPAGAVEFIAPPTTQISPKSWGTTGTQTFKARTKDEQGAYSGWASHSIILSAAPSLITVTFDSQSATTSANPTTKTVTAPATTIDVLPSDPIKTGSTFGGWYTGVNGTGEQFTTSTPTTGNITVYAKWSSTPSTDVSLFVNKSGTGTVTSSDNKINCGSYCNGTYDKTTNTSVTLTAIADTLYTFTGWSGECSGTGVCVVTMDQNHIVQANFWSVTPSPIITTFNLDPKIVNDGGVCKLKLEATNVKECRLINRLGVTIKTFTENPADSIKIQSTDVPIGKYSLECTKLDSTIYKHIPTISCSSNPNIDEF